MVVDLGSIVGVTLACQTQQATMELYFMMPCSHSATLAPNGMAELNTSGQPWTISHVV